MKRSIAFAFGMLLVAACCGDGEKLEVPPLPKDGAALPYDQVLSRLNAQTNAAKEDHFLNRWDGLVDTSVSLEQTAGYLTRSADLPPTHKMTIEKAGELMKADIMKLREAARRKDEVESLELIRRVHNRVRELQELK